MGEAWLDSLSEDWNSQPESASSVVASPQPSRNGSRIPRIKREQYSKPSRVSSDIHRSTSASFSKPRRALSERSNNNISNPLPSSPIHNEPKRLFDASQSLSKSTSSAGSVVKHTVETKAIDKDTEDTYEENSNLDWKKMVMAGVVNVQRRDLFAPMELENIFHGPHSISDDDNAGLDSSLFTKKDLDYVPSSPPPWPRSRKDKYIEELSFSRPGRINPLAVVQELDESEASADQNMQFLDDISIHETNAPPINPPQSTKALEEDPDEKVTENTPPIARSENLDRTSTEGGNAQALGEIEIAALPEQNRWRTNATSDVVPSSSTGFSPVLIYRNNTVDGQIQYTPFVKKKIDVTQRKASHSSSPTLGCRATDDCSPCDLPSLGDNVLVRRGSGSDEASFQRRPLSSSRSSSLLPSDSVSNVQYCTNHGQPSGIHHCQVQLDNGEDQSKDSYSSASQQSTLLRGRSMNGPSGSPLQIKPIRNQYIARTQARSANEANTVVNIQDESTQFQTESEKSGVIHRVSEQAISLQSQILRPDETHSFAGSDLGLSRASRSNRDYAQETSDMEELNRVKEDIEAIDIDGDEQEVSEIKAIASEVATVRVTAQMRSHNIRKPSVCTQDYLDEAMKIMEFIRSKRAPQTELSSLIESAAEAAIQFSDQISPVNLERPPSREGKVSNWRTNHTRHLDPKTLAHLKLYQETDDEILLQSSAADSPDREEVRNHIEPTSSLPQSPLRTVEDHAYRGEEEDEEEEAEAENQPGYQSIQTSPVRTHSSHASVDSNSRTISTNSSSKTRTLPTISPDKVAHLIPAEQAGMRFDSEKKSWVKCRSKDKYVDMNVLSTPLSEDDPFSQIPDLSISHKSEDDLQDEPAPTESVTNSHEQCLRTQSRSESDSDDDHGVVDLQRGPNGIQRGDGLGDLSLISLRAPETPVSANNKRHRHLNHLSSVQRRGLEYGSPGWLHSEPNLSMSRIDEHHEVSLIQTRPDGRTTSFTLSVSTPLPAHRRFSMPVLHSSAVRRNRVFEPLSDLSEFTIDQDDNRHLVSRNLQRPQHQHFTQPRSITGYALITNELVEKLTDAEPDEPYWDWLHALNLKDKNLQSLHMLEEFCPRLEELEASGNHLQHLGGAPASLRQLNVRFNHISSISNWDHLSNLQYLDLTENKLTTLEGLSSLIHLRELVADSNQIRDLKGLFDLNSLLSLSLQGNRLEKIDFEDSGLLRLRELDISGNNIDIVDGLQFLPDLRVVDASNNKIWRFPYSDTDPADISHLQTLCISNNIIEYLDLSSFTALETLDADSNRLSYIKGIMEIDSLQTLALRNQTPVAGSADLASSLNDFSEIRHLYLSANTMQQLPITTTFLNLQTLELAHTGLQSLPQGFGCLAPNLRTLNLNFNALKSIRQLRGAEKLKHLHVAGNRLTRLRKTAASLRQHKVLQQLDLRDNPLTLRFYPPLEPEVVETQLARAGHDNARDISLSRRHPTLSHIYRRGTTSKDDEYLGRLDEETRLKRKVYEVLFMAQCPSLKTLDGLSTHRQPMMKTGGAWDRLVGAGIVEELTGALPVATAKDLD